MNEKDAQAFLADAIGDARGVWADIGAGTGTFTRALIALLAPGSRIYAVDHDASVISDLEQIGDAVVAIRADFTANLLLPEPVDGIVLANALHFVPDAGGVLTALVKLLKPRGRVVIVEYDRRAANPWVPYPIASSEWPVLAAAAGLRTPVIVARRKSEYAGELYVAVAERE